MNRSLHLTGFQPHHAAEIAGWVTSLQEAWAWCGHRGDPLPDPSIFASWHEDPDVHPLVLLGDETPVAYGEIWVDHVEQEIELARLIVRPSDRGQGVGRRLVEDLLRRGSSFGFAPVFMRVLPDNEAALACYRNAGFTRVPEAEEQRFNRQQPVPYVWLRRRLAR